MTAPGASVSAAADLLEESARLKRIPGASASA